MNKHGKIAAVLLAAGIAGTPLLHGAPPEGDIRTIRLLQDDDQVRIVSKLYELKHLKATDIRPFVEAAVKRYSAASKVDRVNYPKAKRQMILVSTGIGITILPESIVSALGHSTDLSFVPLEGDHEYVDILAIWKDDTVNPVTQVFKDFVLQEYGMD